MAKHNGKCPKCNEAIEPTATRCKHCQADLRNWFVRHKIISGCLGLFILAIIISATSSGSTPTATTSVADTAPQEAEAQEPEKEKQWIKVIDLTTEQDKQSETFSLEGGQQKLIYKTTGGDFSMCYVYILKDGTTLEENGGFPEVSIDGTKEDETLMRKSEGDYYFDISTVNGSCAVEIQELR